MDPVAERVARNDDAFRTANERIEEAAEGVVERAPFLCECADTTCTEVIMLDLQEYEHVREDVRRFINVPGHEASAQGWAEVVERHDGFVVVEKVGDAGRLVEELADVDRVDPRGG
jgi:hypothetical protein